MVHDVFVRAGDRLPLDPASYLPAAVVNACRSQRRRTVVARRYAPPPAPLVMPREPPAGGVAAVGPPSRRLPARISGRLDRALALLWVGAEAGWAYDPVSDESISSVSGTDGPGGCRRFVCGTPHLGP